MITGENTHERCDQVGSGLVFPPPAARQHQRLSSLLLPPLPGTTAPILPLLC